MASAQLIVKKRQGRNQCYDEALPDGVMPLRMMQIPAGSFLMGSPEDDLDRRDNEGPQHDVTVAAFFMAKYPVTQAQWRVVAAMPQVGRELDLDPSSFKGDLRPVESVSWHEAVEFCARLTLHTDRQYRLPTEAEWEYACRAGTTTPFHFGPTLSTDYANYNGANETDGAYGPGMPGEYRKATTLVNHFAGANSYGIYDLHGNVWEWCQDHWRKSYEAAPADGSAWIKKGESLKHIVRGGSWDDAPRYCLSTYRIGSHADNRSFKIGFRVCCSFSRLL